MEQQDMDIKLKNCRDDAKPYIRRGNQGSVNHQRQIQSQNHTPRKDLVKERLDNIAGPITNLQTKGGIYAKKFTGRCRLFVNNLPNSITDDEFKNMFAQFGEVAEVFLHKQKGFGLLKLDTRQNAEAAKVKLGFTMKDGRCLRVRFATHEAALKVKNLSPLVSNELLETAFSTFGEVERAVVIVDDRGRPVGEGIVEYFKKQSAQLALKRCTEGCFLLTSLPKPVLVEPLDQRNVEDGLPEKNFQKTNKQYSKEREVGPRLAEMGTFEFELANRWKKLFVLQEQKRDHLEKEIEQSRRVLEAQMKFAVYEHETNLLRERLHHIEEQSTLLRNEREKRREDELFREETRRQQELMLRQQQEDILRDDIEDEDDITILQQDVLPQMHEMMSPVICSNHTGSPLVFYYGGPNGNVLMPGSGMMIPPPTQPRFNQSGFPVAGDATNDMRAGCTRCRVSQDMIENMVETQPKSKRRRF